VLRWVSSHEPQSAQATKDTPGYENAEIKSSNNHFNVSEYLDRYGIEVVKTKRNGSSTLYVLKQWRFVRGGVGIESI